MNSQEPAKTDDSKDQRFSPPAVSLPKGGGAIKGIGEKFAANPVTGTGSLSIPLPLSPGRSGFTPTLALSYDSGSGNGPYGFGWSVGYAGITRRTDRGLPQYLDHEESDVFILSGAEDLVPIVNSTGSQFEEQREGYRITRYRPRIEGLFARIERWSKLNDPVDTFWRSISRDNVSTFYGKTAASRIADPLDPTRIFNWLLCESFDDKGNAAIYEYIAEDGRNVDTGLASEYNRTEPNRSANRYLKRVKYTNRIPKSPASDLSQAAWHFELVMDYGDHEGESPTIDPTINWPVRPDPFSSYRAGFEVRTYRRCRRILMFHRFEELGPQPKLVRSLALDYDDFNYAQAFDTQAELEHPGSTRIGSFLRRATVSGYADNGFRKSMPPLELTYTRPAISAETRTLDSESSANLPGGVDGIRYQWLDLNSEGISGILTEQANAWWYKPNLGGGRLGPQQLVAQKPSLGLETGAQFLDLAGDGLIDLVQLDRPNAGFFERDEQDGWSKFTPFASQPNIEWNDPNLRFVDLTGDGHADVLITEDDIICWYSSLAEEGFGPRESLRMAADESLGPKLVFHDTTNTIFLADISGDGLSDLVRIRNGEVCYWPNLGYGRFGGKVTMDNSPVLDTQDLFEPRRIRLADIDGSGTVDLIYLAGDGVRLYFNRSGNSWSSPYRLANFPAIDNVASVNVTDLLGNGTACLVWSTPLPNEVRAPLHYVDLMGGTKPHLLVGVENNMGARTRIEYTASTRFYLDDQLAGRPWITRLPFPVHVVERTEVFDDISRNRFVTRFAYHHGYFDGVEREFRGFGMVEQFDTEELATLNRDQALAPTTNIEASSHVPPVLTRTWFHTGIYFNRERISNFFAGLNTDRDRGEYYREPGLNDEQAKSLLLDDTVLPPGLTVDEEREACRALKGAMLRQEVYALDGTAKQPHPYSVTEQNFTIRLVQAKGGNPHAVFFSHPREAISYHYERNPVDPRIGHALTLEVDDFGNVLKSVAIGYGRRAASTDSALSTDDKAKQTKPLVTYTENDFTNALLLEKDHYRTRLPAETRTYELTGFKPENDGARFSFEELTRDNFVLLATATEIPYQQTADNTARQKRLVENVRSLYRKDDFTSFLPPRVVEPLALPGETYKLALTPGLVAHIFKRNSTDQPDEDLLPDPATLLEGKGGDQGGYIAHDGNWWIPSGKVFFDPGANIQDPAITAPAELTRAREHFFLPRKFADPFNHTVVVDYDVHDLATVRSEDVLKNVVSADPDYRTLQPKQVTDPNGNRVAAAFDALGMVVATAVMGKEGESVGDLLEDFDANPSLADLQAFVADPSARSASLLGKATTRIVYDLGRFQRAGQPPFAATLARETHFHDPGGAQTKIQFGFTYSDGFGREIQKKIRAEAGDAPQRQADVQLPSGDIRPGELTRDASGKPVLTNAAPRWVGNGRTVFNNKGKPVRQYEPFFSATHLFEEEREMTDTGVSPVLFYDPVERVVATLNPNHTYAKVVFDPWQQTTYDVNDTVVASGLQTGDPRTDPDIAGFVREYFKTQPANWQTWHAQRIGNQLGTAEHDAAEKAAAHADTPSVAYFDSLGRPFLTIAHNKFDRRSVDNTIETIEEKYPTRIELDIEGNQRAVIDAKDRIVMSYDYDLLGTRVHQASMEAGERWMLGDVTGKPICAWDSRGHKFVTAYDELRRPVEQHVSGTTADSDPRTLNRNLLIDKIEYGESQGNREQLNLRTRVYQHSDSAGVVTNAQLDASGAPTESYDFKGNLLRSTRQLARDYKSIPDWSTNPGLEQETFTSSTTYDALSRPISVTAPDNSVYRPTFNEANLPEKVDVNLRGASIATSFVADIDYDAKGQRVLIEYGNNVRTEYTHDPLTFRLTRLKTTRVTDQAQLQDLNYTFDPVGNITRIEDKAQQTIYFNNQVVTPNNDYIYDATYRLINAEGREHIGQASQPQTTWDDQFRIHLPHPNDGQAMRRYTEKYEYDAVGNFLQLIHLGTNGDWTRSYAYNEPNNRLSNTTVGSNTPEPYTHDAHGNMTSMPHLSLMEWNFKDQLNATSRQVVNNGTPETTHYVYDGAGQRIRKVTERQNGTRKNERIYLGGLEVFREYDTGGTSATLERETLHVMDDQQRIALVETRTQGTDGSAALLIRYQLGNHVGSASLELDDAGRVISYEEYYPYGSTSYQGGRGEADTSRKRYRYTGLERDEESGFQYHGRRYYLGWLGRWLNADPIGMKGGLNLYRYASDSPIGLTDVKGLSPDEPSLTYTYSFLKSGTGRAQQDEDSRTLTLTNDYSSPITSRLQKAGGIGGNDQTAFEEEFIKSFRENKIDQYRILTDSTDKIYGYELISHNKQIWLLNERYAPNDHDPSHPNDWHSSDTWYRALFNREGDFIEGSRNVPNNGVASSSWSPTDFVGVARLGVKLGARLVGGFREGAKRAIAGSWRSSGNNLALISKGARAGSKTKYGIKNLFWDSRTSSAVRSQYWRIGEGAQGKHLHHLFIQNQSKWVSQGLRNAGLNLLEVPAGLNTWMGGRLAREVGFRLTVGGTLLGTGYGAYRGTSSFTEPLILGTSDDSEEDPLPEKKPPLDLRGLR